MGLKQISDTVPILLKKTFGGHIVHIKARKRKKALWTWQTTHRAAYNAARQLIFYLQIKKQQAHLFLEFQKTKESKYQKFAFWYEHKHPNWRNEKMVSIQEARKILNFTKQSNLKVYGKADRGTLLCYRNKFPKDFLYAYKKYMGQGLLRGAQYTPALLQQWRHNIKEEIRKINSAGVAITELYEVGIPE